MRFLVHSSSTTKPVDFGCFEQAEEYVVRLVDEILWPYEYERLDERRWIGPDGRSIVIEETG